MVAAESAVDPSDAQLVARAQAGDERAFELLVRRHLRAAHAVATAVLGDPSEAEDVCQDAFLAALRKLDQCDPAEKFAAWLTAIVRNRAIDARRRRIVRATQPLDEELSEYAHAPSNPLHDAERAELRTMLERAVATLSPVQREVVVLHDVEGWKHAEIGALMGLAESTVRVHLFHARRLLRRRLAPMFDRSKESSG